MTTSKTGQRRPRVLIVDDDSDIRAVVAGAVGVMEFEPIEAESGEVALRICQESLPDLIVLDIMMPGMDGNEVCQQVRRLDGGELVPIIMLTARDSVQDKVHSLQGGADDYLTKPFDYKELQARIKALMRVRDLNLRLLEKNDELIRMQQTLVEQERQIVVAQLAGTAAHQLGQPLSAIMLNCHLLESLEKKR